jgi:hypothetical protein
LGLIPNEGTINPAYLLGSNDVLRITIDNCKYL